VKPFESIFDQPLEEPSYPFQQIAFQIPSEGKLMNAIIELTTGRGPHPTIVFFHGVPGNEKNIDLVQILKLLGFNCVIFHYRGSWGSDGDYSFANCLEDSFNVISFLKTEEILSKFRIDKTNLCIVGHSLGGFITTHLMAKMSGIRAAVAVAHFDLGHMGKILSQNLELKGLWLKEFGEFTGPLQGTSADRLIDEMILHRDAWFLPDLAADLEGKQFYLIAAKNDKVAEPKLHYYPLVEKVSTLTHTLLNTEHQFANSRFLLARTIYEWLRTRII